MSVPRPLPSPPPLGTVLGPNYRPSLGGPSRERGKSFEAIRSSPEPRLMDTTAPQRTLPVNPPSFSRASSNETTSTYGQPSVADSLPTPASLAPPQLLPSALPPSPQRPPARPLRSNSAQGSLALSSLPSPTSTRFPPRPPGPSSPVPLPRGLPEAPSVDSPPFRSQIFGLSLRLSTIKARVKSAQRSAAVVSELIQQLADAEDELATGMQELASSMDDPAHSSPRSSSSYGGLRKVWGDEQGVCGRRRAERREERDALEKTVVGPLRDYYERVKDSEKEKLSRKGYEDESKAYLNYVAKYLSSPPSRDSPKLDAAFRARTLQWDLYRFDVESSLANLTLGPRFHQLYIHLLTYPSNLINFAPPAASARDELAQTLSEANEHNLQADEWWEGRLLSHRALLEAARGGGSAVAEDDWDALEHDGPFVGGQERKRDRLGSKIRAAFNLPSPGQVNGGVGAIAQSIAQPFKGFNNRSTSPIHSPVSHLSGSTPPLPTIPASTLLLPPPLSPLTLPSTSSSSGASSPSQSHPQQSVASPEVKRPNRHSIQVLPKSYSSAGLSASVGSGGANALKGIRDLDDRWADLREKEGRKKEGYLWCAGGSSSKSGPDGSGSKGGNWERCWCEVKHSHLIEYRSGQEGVEYASTTDLMFASAREARKSDRRFVIELITRKSTRRFQATSELEMQRWLAALGNAIEASINGTASIRGTSGSTVPTMSSIDDLGLIKPGGHLSGHGLGLGFPVDNNHSPRHSPNAHSHNSSSAGFPFRAWANPLSRKTSMTHKRPSKGLPSHGYSPSEGGGGVLMFSSQGAYDPASSSGSNASHPVFSSPPDRNRHRTSTFHPGPTFQLTTPSPAPSPPPTAKRLGIDTFSEKSPLPYLAQVASPSRLSMTMDRSEDSDSGSGSRGSSFLAVDDLDGIERRVNEMMGMGGSLNGRRALSEGSTFAGNVGGTSRTEQHLQQQGRSTPEALPTISEISKRPENATCVDCRKPNPRWATIAIHDARLVAFLCISCSGHHRSLGSHISKVRSVDLDNWKDEDVAAADRTGNAWVNAVWEARGVDEGERGNMKAFIQAKYVDGRWKSPHHPLS